MIVYPAWISHITIEVKQTCKRAIALDITPQMPGSATSVALPAGGILNITTNHHTTTRTIRDRIRHTNGQFARQATRELHGIDHFITRGILTSIGGIEYLLIIGRPTENPTVTFIIGETASRLT